MALEIILVRHGETDWNRDKRIMGRLPIGLNRRGRSQIQALARHLSKAPIDRIYTSPLRRARETSILIKGRRRIPVRLAEPIAEIQYGKWVGKTFNEIEKERAFQLYNTFPSRARVPGGETLWEAQQRAVAFVEKLRRERKSGRFLLVSHADVIKVIVAHFLRMDLNDFQRMKIDNGAISLIRFDGSSERVLAINVRVPLTRLFS